MSVFDRYVGIDYSGADKPNSARSGLQVFLATGGNQPSRQQRPDNSFQWSRQRLAEWLLDILAEPTRTIVGIDHAFSLPIEFLLRHRITNWEGFLIEFCKHWPTDKEAVKDRRKGNPMLGSPDMFRLTDRRAGSAKSVFQFDVNGQVATSTHAGIPWLKYLRDQLGVRIQFWPFDGFEPELGRSVVAEVYPRLFRRYYQRPDGPSDDHEYDAWMACSWLQDKDRSGQLGEYLTPSLSPDESTIVQLEGWMLGLP